MAETIKIIQWNCRSFKKKRAALQFQLATFDPKVDVVALQETGTQVKITGYTTFNELTEADNRPSTAVAIQRNLTAMQIDLEEDNIPYTFVQLLPRKREHRCVFILNLYSSPKDKSNRVIALLKKACKAAEKEQLVVVGDFNAPHTVWGYQNCTRKGNALYSVTSDLELTLITDPDRPTRIGNSVCRNTTPDLCFVRNANGALWDNTETSLGSDHYLVLITISSKGHKRKMKLTPHTKWDVFRYVRNRKQLTDIADLTAWTNELIQDVDNATTMAPIEEEGPVPDSKLVGLWEKHKDLQQRWLKNKINRTLRRELAALEKEIQDYSSELSTMQWNQLCDSMNGQLSKKNPWTLLKHMLDPQHSKSAAHKRIQKIVHSFPGTDSDLVNLLTMQYLNTEREPGAYIEYRGDENRTLDEDISEAEVRAALNCLRTTSSAGKDNITNKMLRNLDNPTITMITNLFNQHWQNGTLPQEWKDARVVFIPKPGKSLSLESLRPISLTSCLGKAMEHVVLNRLVDYAETNHLFPETMIGFRPKLCTQDILWQVQNDILNPAPIRATRTVLALDIHKAFDNVSHRAILENVSNMNVGKRTYTYITTFLKGRTATLNIGNIESKTIELGTRGTPQGAVLSPFLFNTTMRGLSRQLNEIPHIRHAIYADDVTIWTCTGSDGEISESLQAAADAVQKHARNNGLSCSPKKSELLIVRNKTPANPAANMAAHIQVQVAGQPVPPVPKIRVLGLWIQQNTHNQEAITRLQTTARQLQNLLRRVSNRRHGVKEKDACRLIQAFFLSRVAYVCPYLHLRKRDLERINGLIRTLFKQALGLPKWTSTKALLSLGMHNNVEEIIEAHKWAQTVRLSGTHAGQQILDTLGYRPALDIPQRHRIPNTIRTKIIIPPLPKNMSTENNGRRKARAAALWQCYKNQPAIYVDAARTSDGRHTIAVTTGDGHTISCATVNTSSIVEAEEAAIAMGTSIPGTKIIISDSKTAIRNYTSGFISPRAFRIINKELNELKLVWVPAHAGNPGNEAAHLAARAASNREVGLPDRVDRHEGIHTFNEMTIYYRESRRIYPSPHETLTRIQATNLRRVQTRSVLSPKRLAAMTGDEYPPNCKHCNCPLADQDHILWGCQKNPPPRELFRRAPSHEEWEMKTKTYNPEDQIRLAEWADSVAAKQTPR